MAFEHTEADVQQIHLASMRILEETGMKFHHPEVVDILIKNGVRVLGQTAYFTREQIMEWIGKAPSSFTLYARNPQYDMVIGGDNTELFPATGSSLILEADGRKRPANMEDYVQLLKLYQQSEHYHGNGGFIVQPGDVTGPHSIAVLLYATLVHTDKCLVAGTGKAEEMEALIEMLEIVFGKGDLENHCRAITIANTNTPLQFDTNMLETLMVFARHKQPVIIAACSMAGTTAPVTLAGTIALTNAEVLAGIAVSQMIREGTPVVYGSQTTTSDMRTGSIAIGSPEGALCYEYGARMAKAYGLPCRGGGSLTDAKTLSVQAGYESMLTFLASYRAKTNIIFQSSGIMDSYNCVSYDKFIVDQEIISMAKRYLRGVEVNPETLAVSVIEKVGIAGEFLTQHHTMKYCRKEPFLPDISLRGAVAGDPDEKLVRNIREKMARMLAGYQKPALPTAINEQLKQYLAAKGWDIYLFRSL
ncbi:MAG TPA: trimethylamine methyltransferase family protein, partial [Patescibacteria group bacterium]|nr:trimethylamine methyltransferase family protein [Patescibacteria group bacterium]